MSMPMWWEEGKLYREHAAMDKTEGRSWATMNNFMPYCMVSWQCDTWELPRTECLCTPLNSKLLLWFCLLI